MQKFGSTSGSLSSLCLPQGFFGVWSFYASLNVSIDVLSLLVSFRHRQDCSDSHRCKSYIVWPIIKI